jgi:hypothetical protein
MRTVKLNPETFVVLKYVRAAWVTHSPAYSLPPALIIDVGSVHPMTVEFDTQELAMASLNTLLNELRTMRET